MNAQGCWASGGGVVGRVCKWVWNVALVMGLLWSSACEHQSGLPLNPDELGYLVCARDSDCRPGRFCNRQGYCWVECRKTADCALEGEGLLCDRMGRCVQAGGDQACRRQDDCEEGV